MSTFMPSISNFGRGTNGTRVEIGDNIFWFSYKTLIAFQRAGKPRVVRVNDWSATTGQHLAHIDGGSKAAKDARVSGEEFKAEYEKQIGQHMERLDQYDATDAFFVGV
jgi:hypothetical protein